MNKAYSDPACAIQVIGNTLNDSSILETVSIREDDFIEPFHKIVFGSIYNIHSSGSKVTIDAIVDYLENRPKYNATFKQNNGHDYLIEAQRVAQRDTFNYYYNRLKKLTLLRMYDNIGIDVTDLYDPNNVLDTKKRQAQEDWLDTVSIVEIADNIDNKIDIIRMNYVDDDVGIGYQAGDGIKKLIEGFEKTPEIGIPLYGSLINTVTRGARLRKLYLRSASTGTGKTRSMVADACNFACGEIYDDRFGWINNGAQEPTLFISTEMDLGEMQTMMLAFLSNVNEERILNGRYLEGERERVMKAAEILKNAPLWIECIPDFSLQDIVHIIKKYVRERNIKYVLYDYLMTSLKILEEITSKSRGVRLREDNILFMIATRLKDICNEYGIFIETATQLNANYLDSDTPDQNLLRGAKAIGDKCDMGSILLTVTDDDLAKIEPILRAGNFPKPNIKLSVYKNRRGSYKGIYLWGISDLGTCRINYVFCTTWRYELIPIEDARIIVQDDEKAPWD